MEIQYTLEDVNDEIDSFCRLCGYDFSQGLLGQCPLFGNEPYSEHLRSCFWLLSGYLVTQFDGLSQNICSQCAMALCKFEKHEAEKEQLQGILHNTRKFLLRWSYSRRSTSLKSINEDDESGFWGEEDPIRRYASISSMSRLFYSKKQKSRNARWTSLDSLQPDMQPLISSEYSLPALSPAHSTLSHSPMQWPKPKVTVAKPIVPMSFTDLSPQPKMQGNYDGIIFPPAPQKLRRRPMGIYEEPMSTAASDSEVPNGEPRLRTNSLSSATSSLSIHGRSRECSRRVSGWAVSFDRLLADELGVVCFTEFLKKEFSEENILFWIACEKFSKLTNRSKIKKKAQEIYDTFLTESAIHPVNLDGTVKQMVENNLSSPTSNTYQYAQQQIFHLMKYDSYARFLKCDLYKECIMAEMEGRPLPVQVSDSNGNDQVTGKGKDRIQTSLSSNVSLSDEGTVSSHSDSKKWKKSILPWNRRTRKTSSSKDNLSRQNSVSSEETRNSGDFGQVFCNDNKSEVPKPTMRHQNQSKHYMRVTIPNDSCTRVLIRRGHTMRSAIASICEQRHIPMAAMEVFFADTKEVVDLEQDMANIGPREVVIEKRVLFK